MENEEKMIKCSKCGATIKESQAYCNYCGSINILGAEIDYRHKLEGIRNDLAEMGDDSEEEFKGTLKSGTKFIFIIAGVAVIIGILVFAVYLINKKIEDSHYSMSFNEIQEVFNELDTMYEAGDLDGLYDFYNSSEKKDYRVYDWKHYFFISLYMHKVAYDRDLEWYHSAKNETDKKTSKKWLIYDSVEISHHAERESSLNQLSDEETVQVKEWAREMKEGLISEGIYDESEWQDVYDFFVRDDYSYISIEELDKYLEENNLY